jgi:hypothetical protein
VDHSIADTQPNAGATGATGRWTPEEDATLTSAVTKTRKKKRGKEYQTDWVAIAARVPGRTRNQCLKRWYDKLDPSIDRVHEGTGLWNKDEDIKLKAAVHKHGGKNWVAIAKLVPGRTERQCYDRWHVALDPSIDGVSGCTGKWTEAEDIKIKEAVQKHGRKNWSVIAALVPGRTRIQCLKRWNATLNPCIDEITRRAGKWIEDEDVKLNNAVHMYGTKKWAAIAKRIPDRTKSYCRDRWHHLLNLRIRAGAWREYEDSKLKDSIEMHRSKDWDLIAALVPGRTNKECCYRWNNTLKHTMNDTWSWTEDEDEKLKEAVHLHGGTHWTAIAALIPGRMRNQCTHRWQVLNPSFVLTAECTPKNVRPNGLKTKTSI